MSETDRPFGVIALAVLGAAGWAIGTSAIFVVFRPLARLPRGFRLLGAYVVRGPRGMALLTGGAWLDRPAASDDPSSVSAGRLLGVALLELPFLFALAPLLLGLLVRGGVYQPLEAVGVVAMALASAGWTAVLVVRAGLGRKPDGD